jgi:dephospho-CoA kinase
LISANELLVLLWLSNPAQGQNISINDITKGGLASYVTKYRRSKMPTRETLKIIKKRADDALSIGSITEKDSFNLCIRMAEGHLTQKEVDESLLADNVTDDQFAKKLKEYTCEEENLKLKQKHDAEVEIKGLNKKIEDKDSQIQSLNERLETLEKAKYQKDKDDFVNSKMSKLAKDTWINVMLILAICALWCVNEFYKSAFPTKWSIIIAIGAALATTFGTLFLRKTKFKDYFCRNGLRKRLEKEYDESHNIKDN